MTDEITLTLPREHEFYGIAHLVLGGLAVRLDLTFEALEDLQLALASVLERPDAEGDINVKLRVTDGSFKALVGPFDARRLHATLERRSQEDVSVAQLLEAVVDRVEVDDRGETAWIELTKSAEALTHR